MIYLSFSFWLTSLNRIISRFIHVAANDITVQLLSHVWPIVTHGLTAANQPSLLFTISYSLLKFMSIELVMLSNYLIQTFPLSFCLQSFPASGFSNESALPIRWPKYWSFSISLSMNIQVWFPLGLTDLISFLSRGLSGVFSSTIWKPQLFGAQPSLWSNSHIHTRLLEKPQLWLYGVLLAKWCLCFLICCLGLSPFYGWTVFYCKSVPHILYPFTC